MNTTTEAWTPAVRLDLETASARALDDAIANLKEWSQGSELPALELKSGWLEITPQVAEDLLRRNNSNRRVSFKTVLKYSSAMKRGDWKPTGQSILVNKDGKVDDGQHRLLSSYFGEVPFFTYVITDVPVMPDLFAYIDNSKPRSAADALYTAGGNGLSAVLQGAVKLAFRYDHNALAIITQPRVRDMEPIEVLEYSRAHPGLGHAAHILMGTYPRAVSVIGNKPVAAFVAWQIIETHGMDALDEFMVPLGTGANLDEDDPILALRNRLIREGEEGEEVLKQPRRLALMIRGFNMHIAGQKPSKRDQRSGLSLRDNDEFPRFDQVIVAQAA